MIQRNQESIYEKKKKRKKNVIGQGSGQAQQPYQPRICAGMQFCQ